MTKKSKKNVLIDHNLDQEVRLNLLPFESRLSDDISLGLSQAQSNKNSFTISVNQNLLSIREGFHQLPRRDL